MGQLLGKLTIYDYNFAQLLLTYSSQLSCLGAITSCPGTVQNCNETSGIDDNF